MTEQKMTKFEFDGGEERFDASVALHREVFKNDPILRYLLHTMGPRKKVDEYIPDYIETLLRAAILNHAHIDEAWLVERTDDKQPPQSSDFWFSPGHTLDNWKTYWPAGFVGAAFKMGFRGTLRMLSMSAKNDSFKKKKLGKSPYIYLFWIGTHSSARGQGHASSLIRHLQEVATAQKLPIWLESSSETSHRLYARLGFEDVACTTYGAGKVDGAGNAQKGGSGAPLWSMVWFPPAAASLEK